MSYRRRRAGADIQRRHRRKRVVARLLYTLLGLLMFIARPAPAVAQTIQVQLQGRRWEGKPLSWSTHQVTLQLRDGQLWDFEPGKVESYRVVSESFRPYSPGELRGELMRQFGRGFEVSGTGQYLVVHPTAQRDVWAQRFEQLYRSMTVYFRRRGFPTHRPEFPLVAVVFPTQDDFLRFAQAQNINGVTGNTLGFYHHQSNRVYLYDVTAGRPDDGLWYVNAETIIHEAAHQTAFNLGIHTRMADNPSWVVEGLGTLFEARGVWDSGTYRNLSDRVNPYQLRMLKHYFAGRVDSHALLHSQLTSDQLFQQQPDLAYAHAWGLTFFLTETETARYSQYLSKLRQLEPGAEYSGADRLRDFAGLFGADLEMLDARLRRFIEQL